MICPTCNREVGKIKKHKLINCQCGAKLLAVEVKKKLILCDLKNDKEER